MTVGYTQGTYDLFHIGHLNLIKHAKENCDYLIVGVNSNRLVEEYKNRKPVIDEADRVKIVEAIRYVDKVILCDTLDKEVAWKNNHFDKIFIGTDWQGDKRWANTEEVMKKYDVDVVYLPHTPNISSSDIKKVIKEQHNED